MLSKIDRLGRRTEYTYDMLGRRTLEEWVTSVSPRTVEQFVSYAYDTRGNLTASESGFPTSTYASYAYTYNNASWLTEESLAQSTLLKTKLAIGYDSTSHKSLGLRTLVQASYSTNSPNYTTWTNDYQNEYTYDGKNRLATITQKSQTTGNTVANKYVVLGYDEADRVIDIDRYANTTTSNLVAHSDYTLDNLGRPTAIDHLKGGTTFASYVLTWDARSRLTALDEAFSNSSWDETHDYTYDDTDQLTAADHSVQGDESYTYDENGNRDGSQTHLGGTATWTVDSNNRVTFDGTYNYNYDAEGNLVLKYKTGEYIEYTYDFRNRLSHVGFRTASTGATWQDVFYRYDYQNRMIRRLFDADGTAGGGGTTNKMYIHDGNQIVQIFNRPGSTATLTDRLLWTDRQDYLISDEQVTSLPNAGTVYWALPNHQGTVVDVATYNSGTDTTTIAKHRGFDSFGNITSDSATGVIFVIGYTGKYLDSTTGLQNNINRWYAAALGEWMTEDPISFAGGDENLRRYVGNSPTNYTDPSGLAKSRVVGWIVRRVGANFERVAVIYSERQAAKLFLRKCAREGLDIMVREGKTQAMRIARLIQGMAGRNATGEVLHGGEHALGHWLRGLGRRGARHVQLDWIENRHIFYGGLLGLLALATSENAEGGEVEVDGDTYKVSDVSSIWTDPYPGESGFHALTATYWAGEDSCLSYVDWINPLEWLAIAGDAGRAIDRAQWSELIGVSITLDKNGAPFVTINLDPDGNLVSVGYWNDGDIGDVVTPNRRR